MKLPQARRSYEADVPAGSMGGRRSKVEGDCRGNQPERGNATRGLLATDLVILNHGQVTKTTPKLAPSSPNFRTIPTGGRLSIDRFNVHQPLLHGGSSTEQGSYL
ncbi:hypothetical protein TNCV_2542691 [Trichonephila clavipes]|nr:hypothetical protein TNCV_2542691 [Trichonephila clavipes]